MDQSPSEAMMAALKPMMSALAAKGMLSHPDTDVRVAVAACISEVTRITAPDAPYDDDLMKVLAFTCDYYVRKGTRVIKAEKNCTCSASKKI